jgi:hypothetical protein
VDAAANGRGSDGGVVSKGHGADAARVRLPRAPVDREIDAGIAAATVAAIACCITLLIRPLVHGPRYHGILRSLVYQTTDVARSLARRLVALT